MIAVGQRLEVVRLPGQVQPEGGCLLPRRAGFFLEGGALVWSTAAGANGEHIREFLLRPCLEATSRPQDGGEVEIVRPGIARLSPEAFGLLDLPVADLLGEAERGCRAAPRPAHQVAQTFDWLNLPVEPVLEAFG